MSDSNSTRYFCETVINVTLPDDEANYLHRIGRVGRAERQAACRTCMKCVYFRMGLAISLVSKVPEKVWYHGCPSKGKNCHNTRLTTQGGCCIWNNEMQVRGARVLFDARYLQMLSTIEEKLGCTITQVDQEINVPMDEFDGKVTYGTKRKAQSERDSSCFLVNHLQLSRWQRVCRSRQTIVVGRQRVGTVGTCNNDVVFKNASAVRQEMIG
jgi:hypothetical protein